MRTITGETTAWLMSHADASDLKRDPKDAINALSFSHYDMTDAGWIRVGKATINVEIPDDDQLVASAISSLRAEIQKTRADAEVKCMALNERIERLLALEYTPA